MPIIVSEYALETTDVRLFPESKNRSARIHKKLVQRVVSQFEFVQVGPERFSSHLGSTHQVGGSP